MLVDAGVALEAQDRNGRTPLHLACLMADKGQRTRGNEHVSISSFLQAKGANTGTQDAYGHTPLSYLGMANKRVGLNAPAISGYSSKWATEEVHSRSAVLKGSVAQAAIIQQT